MNKRKKILLLFACLSLLLFITSTVYTYAKYYSQTNRDIGTNIKKWKIKVNNNDIKNGETLGEEISATFEGSEHIAENTMAPGSIGSFEIELDYSNVEVSFEYEIGIEKTEIEDIEIYKLEVDGTEITGNGLTITNQIDIKNDTDTDKIKKIKVSLIWNDDENASLNNSEDTQIAINNNTIDFNISLKLTQIQEP